MSVIRFVPEFLRVLPERAGRAMPTGRTIFLGPLMIAIIFAAGLVAPPQAREIYLDITGDRDLLRGILGLLGVQWLAIALYAWNATLVGRRIDTMFREKPSLSTDRWLKSVRDRKALISAMLPPMALVVGLLNAIPDIRQAEVWIGKSDPKLAGLANELAAVPARMWLAALVALIAGCMTLAVLVALRRTRFMPLINRASLAAAVVVYLLPLLDADVMVEWARWVGPLAAFAIVGVAVVPTIQYLLVGIARFLFGLFVGAVQVLTRRVGPWPLVVVLVGLMGYWLWQRQMSILEQARVDPIVPVVAMNEPGDRTIDDDIAAWLDARGIGRDLTPPRKFPILVVAAQGGGIYAASATMTLLSGLQDRCSRFARHVFAISAVSGGAIGAAAFQRFAANGGIARQGDCQDTVPTAAAGALTPRASRIATDDHLSGAHHRNADRLGQQVAAAVCRHPGWPGFGGWFQGRR